MSIKPIFAWYDLWVGCFWDAAKRRLYFFPVPMLGVVIQFQRVMSSRPAEMKTPSPIPNCSLASGCVRHLVRWLSAWAWRYEIRRAKDFERVRDDKWRYRVALENVLESATPNQRDHPKMFAAWKQAHAALYPLNETSPSVDAKEKANETHL